MLRIFERLAGVGLVLLLVSGPVQPARAQVLSALFGAGAGSAAGGYITLSIVVARAQAGHYLHDAHDVFGIGSMTVIAGGTSGLVLGAVAPDRMWTGFIYSSASTVAVGTIGFIGGALLSTRPESKWAYAAIGAGVGMALGSLVGVMSPNTGLVRDLVPKEFRQTSAVPIGFTVRF